MITLLKIFVTLVILGGSSYGYFSSHKQKAVENGETQNTQQKATSENIETIPNEPSDKDITAPVQEAEKEKIDEPIVSAVTTPKAPDEKEKKKEGTKKKKESSGGKSITSLSQEGEKNADEDSKNEAKACFEIRNLIKYSEDVYYRKSFSLDASCSRDAKSYTWYFNGVKAGAGVKLPVPTSIKIKGFSGFREGVVTEIKLVTTSSDGVSKSESKKISFRKIPEIKACITPKATRDKEFVLGEEIEFDASCTEASDENPITKYTWTFRDGKDGEQETGKKVEHAFSKAAPDTAASDCNRGAEDSMVTVQLLFETKLGLNSSVQWTYCIKI